MVLVKRSAIALDAALTGIRSRPSRWLWPLPLCDSFKGTMRRTDSLMRSAGLLSLLLFFAGLFLVTLSVLMTEVWHATIFAAFVRDIGLLLSAVMAGTMLHERLLRQEMLKVVVDELDKRLEARIPTLENISDKTSKAVHGLFSERPPEMTGLRFVCEARRDYGGYYDWVNERKPQELFFAGRSVLHRIDADIRKRTKTFAEDVLLRRLTEGSKIKILFLDPRTSILERLAKEEGQRSRDMLADIATSLGICRRLQALLEAEYEKLQPGAQLGIRVYDRVPYFAYHQQDDIVLVGFYFRSTIGSTSAAYEPVDVVTKQVFGVW